MSQKAARRKTRVVGLGFRVWKQRGGGSQVEGGGGLNNQHEVVRQWERDRRNRAHRPGQGHDIHVEVGTTSIPM